MRRILTAIALTAACTAAEPVVTDYEIDDAILTIRANDVGRMLERFEDTPYAALLADPGTQKLIERTRLDMGDQAAGITGEVLTILRTLQAGSFSVAVDTSGFFPLPKVRLGMRFADNDTFLDMVKQHAPDVKVAKAPPEGAQALLSNSFFHLFAIGDLVVITGANPMQPDAIPATPTVTAKPRPTTFPEADIEYRVDYAPIAKVIQELVAKGGGQDPEEAEQLRTVMEMLATLVIDAQVTLTDYGQFELLTFDPTSPVGKAMASPSAPAANRDLVTSLPGNTLFALSWPYDPATTAEQMAVWGANSDAIYEDQDKLLSAVGLPPMQDMLAHLDGDALLYATAPDLVGGLPAVFICLPIKDEAMAKQLIGLLKDNVPVTAATDTSLTGSFGPLVPWSVSWHDGVIIATTHIDGAKAHLERDSGFADHADVKQALTHIPDDALAIGISRTAETWKTINTVAQPFLMMGGIQHPAASGLLPAIGKYGKYGFFYSTRNGEIASGGLLTMLETAIGLGAGATVSMDQMGRAQAQERMQERAEEEEFNDF